MKRRGRVTFSAILYRTSSIFMHVGSQSCPKRMTTTRSSSERMAWSTCQPLCKCGSMYDILATEPASAGEGLGGRASSRLGHSTRGRRGLAQTPPTGACPPPGTSAQDPAPRGPAPCPGPRPHLAPLRAVSARTSGDTGLPAQPSPGRGRAQTCACAPPPCVRPPCARAPGVWPLCWSRGRPRWSLPVGCERAAPRTRGPRRIRPLTCPARASETGFTAVLP